MAELPPSARVAFYALVLGSLAVADAVFEDWYVPLAVLVALLLFVLPVFVRRFGRSGGGQVPKASGRAVVYFAAALTLLTAVEVALVPDFGLSALFWIVAILIPSLEFLAFVTRREARSAS